MDGPLPGCTHVTLVGAPIEMDVQWQLEQNK
jgi:hypothetical protein